MGPIRVVPWQTHTKRPLPFLQLTSSEPSTQSRMPLHCLLPWMQLPSSHSNWSGRQVREATKGGNTMGWSQPSCSQWIHEREPNMPHWWERYVRQLTSSLPSLQSESPSHRHFLWMHSPEPHWISLAGHLVCITGWRPHSSMDSSDWSEQSASLSHTQLWGMQEEALHWNSWAPHDGGAQLSSSLPSLQSSWPLHTKFLEMQRPLEQVNSSALHVMLPIEREEAPLKVYQTGLFRIFVWKSNLHIFDHES